jgi:hypothetical protein
MLRFIVRQVYVGHVVFAGGEPEINHRTIDGDIMELENYLRYTDQAEGKRPDYLTRELVGVELIDINEENKSLFSNAKVFTKDTLADLQKVGSPLESDPGESWKDEDLLNNGDCAEDVLENLFKEADKET